jgi:hypothetical protein
MGITEEQEAIDFANNLDPEELLRQIFYSWEKRRFGAMGALMYITEYPFYVRKALVKKFLVYDTQPEEE